MTVSLSVLVASYNRPEFIAAAVRSALDGAEADIEVIVCDDASPHQDAIMAALREFRLDSRFRWMASGANRGWSGTRNALLSCASGEYVLQIGDDDMLKPGYAQQITAAASRVHPVDIIAFGYEEVDEHGRVLRTRCTPGPLAWRGFEGGAGSAILRCAAMPFWAFHPFSFAVRREAAMRFPYRAEAGIGDDLLFLLELCAAGATAIVLPKVLFQWRKHSKGHSSANLSGRRFAGLRARAAIVNLIATSPLRTRLTLEGPHALTKFASAFLADAAAVDGSATWEDIRRLAAECRGPAGEALSTLRWRSLRAILSRSRDVTIWVRLFKLAGLSQLLSLWIRERLARRM